MKQALITRPFQTKMHGIDLWKNFHVNTCIKLEDKSLGGSYYVRALENIF